MLDVATTKEAAENAPVQLNLRVPKDMAVKLDAWLEELNSARGWPKLTRTDVLRSLLDRALVEKPDWVGKLRARSRRSFHVASYVETRSMPR